MNSTFQIDDLRSGSMHDESYNAGFKVGMAGGHPDVRKGLHDPRFYFHGFNVARFVKGIRGPRESVVVYEGRKSGAQGKFYRIAIFAMGHVTDVKRAFLLAAENGIEVNHIVAIFNSDYIFRDQMEGQS